MAILFLSALSLGARAYDYPIQDRFAATIVGTPEKYAAVLPAHVPVKVYELPGIKEIPRQFWYQKGPKFSVAKQKGRAPLVFLIAGTGAAYDSSKMVFLQKALYGAGFHVVNISSPTHFNFIVNASTSSLPGYLPDDTLDLYRVMEQAWALIRGDVEASEFSVGGYSLGGINAAFLAAHDEQAGSFGFRHALMINPPVDLYSSVTLLDGYLRDNVPAEEAGTFLDQVIDRLATAYNPDNGMRLDGDFLFRAYERRGSFAEDPLIEGGNAAAALIGMSFRLSSSAMLFAGDVMARTGYIAPADKNFGRAENLDYYAWASSHVPFARYVDELLVPELMKRHPGKTREQLLHEASLRGIEPYIHSSSKIYALTNADEIILAPGELEYLRAELGERIHIYPYGGHCGNISYRDNVRDIIAVFRGEALASGA
ncbi:MAG: alpha/beta fold hydrolase [Gammaproteobacteria bacterium]|nr:alpha/beta fold hydrolase [Gammaproteobacteria bacterium]